MQVLDVLEADRDAHQALRDARLGELGIVELAMRAGRRMHGDRLDAPQRRGARRDRERIDEGRRGRPLAEVEREHAAAGTQLPLGHGRLRVADARPG